MEKVCQVKVCWLLHKAKVSWALLWVITDIQFNRHYDNNSPRCFISIPCIPFSFICKLGHMDYWHTWYVHPIVPFNRMLDIVLDILLSISVDKECTFAVMTSQPVVVL